MHNVFTYGSLMFAPVWSQVVDGVYAPIPARLDGFQRLAVKGEAYPAAVPLPTGSMKGLLYPNISPNDLARLDAFEGKYYLRTPVTVATANGVYVTAWAYILDGQYRHILDTAEWDVGTFAAEGIQHFLARYPGFNA
jgi:gamma-glutamylcyclotransferase (GGCT)/AIG2-like uncharacterized protein YtfP